MTTFVAKDARDKEKEVMTRQGQAHVALFNVGGKINVDSGKVTDLAYSVPSTIMEGPCPARPASASLLRRLQGPTGRPKRMIG